MNNFADVSKHFASRSNAEMQKVLMHPGADGPAIHYYMIRGGSEQRNITVWEPGTVGGEYVKSFGHYHVGNLSETYSVLCGEGVVLLQKAGADPAVIEEFKAIPVKPGDQVFISAGFGHAVANTGSTFLVTADDSPVDFSDRDPASLPGHADYSAIEKMHGMAYYVVERDGRPALVPNPHYRVVKSINAGGLTVIEAEV